MGAGLACKPQCCESGDVTTAFDHTGFSSVPDGNEKAEPQPLVLEDAVNRELSGSVQRTASSGSGTVARSNSVAARRFRASVRAVSAARRFGKAVRFKAEEEVAEVETYEVTKSNSDVQKGFQLCDKVCWMDRDNDIPKGSVGDVLGFREKDIVQVRFPTGTWDFKASELVHYENWAANLMRVALKQAEAFMRELRVLEAEDALAEALEKLQEVARVVETLSESESFEHSPVSPKSLGVRSPGLRRAMLLSASEASEAVGAIRLCCKAKLYMEILRRVRQYEALGQALLPDGFRLAFQGRDTQIWVRNVSRSTSWREYKLVCDMGDAGLRHCLAHSHELDLRHKYDPRLLDKPEYLGPVHPLRCVTRTLMRVTAFRVELVLEVFRWFNYEYGFYGESTCSTSPALEGGKAPSRGRCHVAVDSSTLWIPKGGGRPGTMVVTLVRLRAGERLAKWLLSTFIKQVATAHASDMQAQVQAALDPSSPYAKRLEEDKTGFYQRLSKVEAVAAKRASPPPQIGSLPDPAILRRLRKLPQPEDLSNLKAQMPEHLAACLKDARDLR